MQNICLVVFGVKPKTVVTCILFSNDVLALFNDLLHTISDEIEFLEQRLVRNRLTRQSLTLHNILALCQFPLITEECLF